MKGRTKPRRARPVLTGFVPGEALSRSRSHPFFVPCSIRHTSRLKSLDDGKGRWNFQDVAWPQTNDFSPAMNDTDYSLCSGIGRAPFTVGRSPIVAGSAGIGGENGVVTLASISFRNLDDRVKERLRIRAAVHGRSMESEIRANLAEAVSEPIESGNVFAALLDRFGGIGGVELDLSPRVTQARAPDLSA